MGSELPTICQDIFLRTAPGSWKVLIVQISPYSEPASMLNLRGTHGSSWFRIAAATVFRFSCAGTHRGTHVHATTKPNKRAYKFIYTVIIIIIITCSVIMIIYDNKLKP